MATITDYFAQAQLSMAAYAVGLQPGMFGAANYPVYVAALVDAGMSQKQAEVFADTYSVVDQYNDPSTGLSATVFQKGGQYYLALRGTTGILDLLADAQLLFGGAVRTQIVSLYNYAQRLITPAGQSALQVQDLAPDIDPITGYVNDLGGIRTTTSVAGLGYLAGVSGVTATGHSLGGHLAAASRLFPGLIASTDTYNAPGFSLNYADALLDQFPGDAGAFPATTMTNLVANVGADIIAAVGTLPGTPARIFIEDQGAGLPGNVENLTLSGNNATDLAAGTDRRGLFPAQISLGIFIQLLDRRLVMDRGKPHPVAITVGLKQPTVLDATVDLDPHLVLGRQDVFLEIFDTLVSQSLLKPVTRFRGLGEDLDDQRRRALIVGTGIDRPADHDEVRVIKGVPHPYLHVGHEHAARRTAKVLAQAGGEGEGDQIVQAARPRHGIHRACDVLMTDVAAFFAFQIFFHRDRVELLDKGHGQTTSAITDIPQSTSTRGKGNGCSEGGLSDNRFFGGTSKDVTRRKVSRLPAKPVFRKLADPSTAAYRLAA